MYDYSEQFITFFCVYIYCVYNFIILLSKSLPRLFSRLTSFTTTDGSCTALDDSVTGSSKMKPNATPTVKSKYGILSFWCTYESYVFSISYKQFLSLYAFMIVQNHQIKRTYHKNSLYNDLDYKYSDWGLTWSTNKLFSKVFLYMSNFVFTKYLCHKQIKGLSLWGQSK